MTNLFSSRRRLCELIQAEDGNFCPAWNKILDETASMSADCTRGTNAPADLVSGKLSDLPLISYHGKDAGPYFTSAIYLAKDPDTKIPNLSFHRSMYVGDGELRIRLGATHDLAKYQQKAEKKNEALEAALLIGVSPASAGDYDGARAAVTPEMMNLAIVGSPKDAIAKIELLAEAGVTQVSIGGPLGPDPGEAIRLFGEQVIPYFR